MSNNEIFFHIFFNVIGEKYEKMSAGVFDYGSLQISFKFITLYAPFKFYKIEISHFIFSPLTGFNNLITILYSFLES